METRYIQARNIKPFTHSIIDEETGDSWVVAKTSWATARILGNKISDIQIGDINSTSGVGGIEIEIDGYLPVIDSSEEAIAEAKAEINEQEIAKINRFRSNIANSVMI